MGVPLWLSAAVVARPSSIHPLLVGSNDQYRRSRFVLCWETIGFCVPSHTRLLAWMARRHAARHRHAYRDPTLSGGGPGAVSVRQLLRSADEGDQVHRPVLLLVQPVTDLRGHLLHLEL